jgi:hypothetical protein
MVVMAARRIVATSGGGGHPSRQSRRERRWLFFTFTQHNSSLQSVIVHAVLGGDGPRWQPLNSAGRHPLLAKRQLESVLAGGNGDGGIQLRRDDDGARPSAGKRLVAAMAERTGFDSDGL